MLKFRDSEPVEAYRAFDSAQDDKTMPKGFFKGCSDVNSIASPSYSRRLNFQKKITKIIAET